MKLREEYEQLSRDYQEACRSKHESEEKFQQIDTDLKEAKGQVSVLESKVEE